MAVEVFEGNTGDPKTVAAQIRKLRQRFRLKEVVVVGDRGMLTPARIREDLESEEGVRWITALKARRSSSRPPLETCSCRCSINQTWRRSSIPPFRDV